MYNDDREPAAKLAQTELAIERRTISRIDAEIFTSLLITYRIACTDKTIIIREQDVLPIIYI